MEESSLVQGTVTKFSSLADGTLRVQVDIHQKDSPKALELLCEVGAQVAVARLVDSGALAPEGTEGPAEQLREAKGPHGEYIAAMYRAGWFVAPPVLEALGSDAQYLGWLAEQPCAYCASERTVVAAHVRRVAAGAGTAVKPPFSAIPLCNDCHVKQHTKGEQDLAPRSWFDAKSYEYLAEWAHERFRLQFTHMGKQCTSLTFVEPWSIVRWAEARHLEALLPRKVKEAALAF